MAAIGFTTHQTPTGDPITRTFLASNENGDPGISFWTFLMGLQEGGEGAWAAFAAKVRQVEWISEDPSNEGMGTPAQTGLEVPVGDILQDVVEGRMRQIPEHEWRAWIGPSRWGYFVNPTNRTYEICRYGDVSVSTGAVPIQGSGWGEWMGLRCDLMDQESSIRWEEYQSDDSQLADALLAVTNWVESM